MELDLETQKKIASEWFKFLQLKILEEFQYLEKEFSKRKKVTPKYFKKNDWKKENFDEGGGTYYILKNGQLFEKVGINHSTVEGIFPKKFKGNITGAKKKYSLLGFWHIGRSSYEKSQNAGGTFQYKICCNFKELVWRRNGRYAKFCRYK